MRDASPGQLTSTTSGCTCAPVVEHREVTRLTAARGPAPGVVDICLSENPETPSYRLVQDFPCRYCRRSADFEGATRV